MDDEKSLTIHKAVSHNVVISVASDKIGFSPF